ncbi:LamG domain-containing protein (plasmid) [Paenibacillus rhizovicinus]|uniref:LamG domain-containing protein n=1 Tax=Paenibacillus rhizovicinus TaxID=2704463 RepID=A0A6C0PCX7_9BACL|nr:LamG domain-containing protein [Paenibacillus rhizovicinus]QHW35642.1 LamG domain-containing protein [Paenibacillus rhizovicinus]
MGLDVISYGAANKAAKEQKKTREDILSTGVEGSYPNVKARIDHFDQSLDHVVAKANKLIINDTINIIKANAKLNAVAKTLRYKHQNMLFEDFLDGSGIDIAKSSGYTLNTTEGKVTGGTIITTTEIADSAPEKAVLVVEEYVVPETATYFDGNDYIKNSSVRGLPSGPYAAFTLEAWVKPNSNSASGTIVRFGHDSSGQSGALSLVSGKLALRADSSNYDIGNATNIPGGVWTHLAISIDEQERMKFYINGVLDAQKKQTAVMSVFSTGYTEIGSFNSSDYFSGAISDVRIWNGVRTDAEIADNMSKRLTGNETKLERYYKLDDPVGSGSYKDSAHYDEYVTAISTPGWPNTRVPAPFSGQTGMYLGKYSISRDDGTTWERIVPETLFYFTDRVSPKDKKLRIKVVLEPGVTLNNYGITWS